MMMIPSISSNVSMVARRRVVVTGIGAVTPLGGTFRDSWTALLQGHCGITSLEEALQCQLPSMTQNELAMAKQLNCQVAAAVKGLNGGTIENYNPSRTPRFVHLGLLAGEEALKQAQLLQDAGGNSGDNENDGDDNNEYVRILSDPCLTGVSMGCAMSFAREVSNAPTSNLRKLSPYFVPKVLNNSVAGRLSIAYGLQGPNQTAATACAAGSHGIADAYSSIINGHADVMLAGGSESCIDPLSMAGFSRLRALSTVFKDDPSRSSRPFDTQRGGFVMGEGAACLVLEELEHALRRQPKVTILAELCGYGLTGDAHHITSPHPSGRGAERCMIMALRQAGVSSMDEVGYVNAHATSTPKGDEIEAHAIHRVFFDNTNNNQRDKNDFLIQNNNISTDERTQPLLVSSTKGSTAHLLGAAGAIEAAFAVQALVDQCAPQSLNLEETDEEWPGLEFVKHQPHKVAASSSSPLEVAMSNSFGFGGVNACLVFRRWNGV